MIAQVFNSGVISGPELLVFSAMPLFQEQHVLVFIVESRLGAKGREPFERAKAMGFRAESVEISGRLDISGIGRLRGILQWLDPRIVHCHDVKASTYSWLASGGKSWKVVSTHHGVLGRPDWKSKVYERLYSWLILPRMDMCIAVSREDEGILKKRGLNPQLLSYVPNGVSGRRLGGAERSSLRSRHRALLRSQGFDIKDGEAVVGVVGRLSPEKGHAYLFRVAAELLKIEPQLSWKIVIVGSGTHEKTLRRESQDLGIADLVHWLGYRHDAAGLIPAFDLLAIPSQAEGLPIVALEAGWAGVPVFASNVGGLPELVSTGRFAGGIIFPKEQEHRHTAKSLAWILQDPQERDKMGTHLQDRVSAFYSGESWVRQMEEIYRTI